MWLFGLHFAGDPMPFLIGTILYLFCNVAFGTMAGSAIPDQASPIQVVAILYPNLLALIGFAVLLVAVSAWRFRKQLG